MRKDVQNQPHESDSDGASSKQSTPKETNSSADSPHTNEKDKTRLYLDFAGIIASPIIGLIGIFIPSNLIPFPPDTAFRILCFVLILLLTVTLLCLADLLSRHYRKKSFAYPALIIFVAVVFISIFVLAFVYHPPEGDVHLDITSPVNNGTVGLREFIRGTSTNYTGNKQIWIMVKPHNMVTLYYYPQNYTTTVYADGSWSAEAYFGNQTNGIGEKFDIIPVVANATAQASFNTYLKESASKGSWDGLPVLPEGADQQTSIAVTRTSNSTG
jgi:hypothetical protein